MSSKTFPSSGTKPTFNPNASFEAVQDTPAPTERKPAFNPNAHFEPVHEARQLSPEVQKMMEAVAKIPTESASFEIKQPSYQVNLSQPTFRAIPQTKETALAPSVNEPINIEKQKDQYIPDERSMVMQKKQGEARVRQEKLNTELQSNDALYEKKIREYRRDNYTLENLKNDYKQKGQILSPQDEQSFLQKEKQRQYDRPITPEDITDFKTGTIITPKLSRKFIKDLNNPEISAHAYKVDKYNEVANDPDPLNYMRFDKIDENDKNIKKGFLVYNPETKQLIKPVGIIGSAIEGTMNKLKQEDKYNFYKNASDQSIIDELENERNKPDTDEPIVVPKGKLAEFVKEGSQMPVSPLLAGAIGSLAGPQAGTWAATAVGAYENRKAQFTSTLPQVYNELRNQGVEKGEAFRKAKAQAENAQEIGTIVGAGQGLIGAEIGKIPFGGSYNKAIGNTLKQNGTSWGKLFAEGAGQGTIGATGEALKNALAKQAGINRPIDEGTLENFIYNAGMAVGIGGAIKAGKGLSKIDYRNIMHGLSKQPEEAITNTLQEKVQNGEITQKAADETQQRINEYKGLDLLIPSDVSDEARFKIQDKIKKRQEYEKQLETQDKAYHPEIKEKIKALDEEIVNLTKEGKEKPIKPESGLTKDQEKEATEIAEEWLHEGIIPDSYEGAIKKDPIGFWKFLSQQAHNTDENWRPNEDPSPEQGMREDLGDTVVDYAKELFPAPKKETPQSVSVIQPGEIQRPETITVGGKPRITPESENIIPNKEFQTMGMGNDEGKDETKEARTLMKQRMLQGDIPIDGEGGKGETGRGFAGRVISAWENLKKSGGNNTTLVTHSSVLKAIKAWENPETWKGVEKPTDPANMNNDQWLKFADEYNKESTENGDLETFKGDNGDIHVIRHGQTEDNKMNKFRSGNTNLTDEGIQQAHDVGKRLQEKTGGNVPQIVSSDLPRAIHTSNIIHENLKPIDHAISIGEPATVSLDVSSGSSQEVGQRVPESGETTNAQGRQGASQEGEGTGKEKVKDLSITDAYGLPFIEEAGDKRTGIKNVISKMTRFERKLPEVEVPKLSPDQKVLEEGKDLVDSGKINPLDVVNRILDTKGGMQPDEAKAMQYYMYQLGQHETNLREQLAKVADGSVEHAELNGQIQQLSDEIDAATEANVISGKAWSDVGNIRQIVADTGFNASREKATIKEAYGGKIPEDVQKRLDAVLKERDAALNKLAKLQEQKKQADAEATIKSQSAPKNPKKTSADFKEERTQIKKDISEKLRKGRTGESGLTAVPLPFAKELIQITPDIFKLIKSYAEEGVQKTEEVINRLHDVLKDELNGITKADIVNLLAGKYKAEGENVSVISQRIRDFRTEANLWTKIAQATKMEEDSPQKKELKNKKLRDLKDRLNEIRQRNKEAIAEMKDILTSDAQKEVQRLQRQRKGLETQLKNKKYLNTEEKPNVPINSEIVKEQQKIINANYKIKTEKRKAFESQKNWYQKGLMWAGRGFRLSILSGYNVLAKLGAASTIGGALKRIPEQGIGYIYGQAFKGIAEKAPIEGYINANSEAKFYKEFFNPKKFTQNAWEILKTGASPLSKKFGSGEYEHIPGLYLPTDLHQIIKDPLKRGTYESSLKNAMVWAEKNGLDINDDLVMQSLETAAYKRAQYEIFQEQNWLSKKFGAWKSKMEQSGNWGATGKFLADFMIPVSTVPTNIARRVVTTSPLGLIRGTSKVIEAYRNGIENLSHEQADSVMRQLKQGTLGTALWLIGWYGYSHFGGLYTRFDPNKKRGEDLKSDEMSVGGAMVPKPVQHALPLEVIQMAATARRVFDLYNEQDKPTFESIEKAGLASIGGLVEQIPVLETGAHAIGATTDPYEAKKLEEDAKRRFEPQILRETGIIPKTSGSSTNGGGAGASGTYEKPTRTKPEHPHKTHR